MPSTRRTYCARVTVAVAMASFCAGCGVSSLSIQDAQGRLWGLDRPVMLSTVDKIGGGTVATREVGECEGEGYIAESSNTTSDGFTQTTVTTSTDDSEGIGREVVKCLKGQPADAMLRINTLRSHYRIDVGMKASVLMEATVEVPKEGK